MECNARLERALPKGIHVRKGQESDEIPAFDVMRRAMGFEITWENHASIRNYIRLDPSCIFWVAEERSLLGGTKIFGYIRALIREKVMCLTEFFVLPGHQSAGIGTALIEKMMEDADRAGAVIKMVLASQSPAALRLYIKKAGCFPRIPMIMFSAAESMVIQDTSHIIEDQCVNLERQKPFHASDINGKSPLIAEPIQPTPELEALMSHIDRKIVGFARPQEHRHWLDESGGQQGTARLFRYRQSGEIAGYAYMGKNFCGPVLSLNPEYQPWMITHAASLRSTIQKAEQGLFAPTREIYCSVAGSNETMLIWLVNSGWKLMFHYTFMSSHPMGMLDRYIGHEPLYLL